MISLFKNNQIFNLLLLIPYTIIIRIHSFLHPEVYNVSEHDSSLARLIFSTIGTNSLLHSILSSAIVVTLALLLGIFSNKYRLFKRPSLYPSFFFVILVSITSEIQQLSPALISLLFLVLFLRSCLKIYRYHLSGSEVFNIGVFTVISALIYPPYTILIVIALVAVVFFIGFNIKDLLRLSFGVFSILIIVISMFFYFDILSLEHLISFGRSRYLFSVNYWIPERIIFAIIITSILGLGFLSYYNFLKKKIIDARKKITFLYIFVIFLLPVPFIFSGTDIYYLMGLCMVGAIFVALFLDGFINNIAAEFIHLSLLLILFGLQFNLFGI